MAKILVTGAKGMLGQDLCPLIEDANFTDEIIESDLYNFDITDELQVKNFITKEKPDFIIHCAAYTNVDGAETEPEIAEKINIKGTENIAKYSASTNATLIFISTDYVFDGEKKEKYLPNDKQNPINKYGQTKFEAEQSIQKICKKYYIIRTSWLYGHHGKNFVETMLKLAEENKEIKVVSDQIGSPTWTAKLSEGICSLIEENPEYGIYHICGNGETSWYDFAKEIFKISGINAKLSPCSSNDYKSAAKRPKYSVLESSIECESWKKSLKSYLALRINE